MKVPILPLPFKAKAAISLLKIVMQSNSKRTKEKDMGYFKRVVISNSYFEGVVTSKTPKDVLGFLIIFSVIFYSLG
jgi:hypothetical protein